MLIFTVPWDLRAAWAALTVTAKFYFVCLLVAAAYSSYSLASIAVRARHWSKCVALTDANNARFQLIGLHRKLGALRQCHTLLFLSFGACFTNEMFAGLRSIKYSSMSLCPVGIAAYEPAIALAFSVFVALTFLHSFQWAITARLQSKPWPAPD
jgi:hypothetical protein